MTAAEQLARFRELVRMNDYELALATADKILALKGGSDPRTQSTARAGADAGGTGGR